MPVTRKVKRELALLVWIIVCFSIGYWIIFVKSGYLALRQNRLELIHLQKENDRLRNEVQSQLEKLNDLKNQPSEVERIAREQYNFSRSGDIVIHVQKKAP